MKNNKNTADPRPPTPKTTIPVLDVADEAALLEAAMAEVLEKYSTEAARQAGYFAAGLASSPNVPRPRKKRYVGGLKTPSDVASELAAIYKEAYHNAIPWHQLTRATYALDCLTRAMQASDKPVAKTKTPTEGNT